MEEYPRFMYGKSAAGEQRVVRVDDDGCLVAPTSLATKLTESGSVKLSPGIVTAIKAIGVTSFTLHDNTTVLWTGEAGDLVIFFYPLKFSTSIDLDIVGVGSVSVCYI